MYNSKMTTMYGAVYQKLDEHTDSTQFNRPLNNNEAAVYQTAPKKTCCWFFRIFLTFMLIGLSTFVVVYLISFRHQILPTPSVNGK